MAGMGVRPLGGDDPRRLGAYRLVGRLGSGGMGRIYLARSAADGSLVAVKTLLAEGAVSDTDRRRFAREVALARRVDSAYTARVRDADPDAERPWMAIDYIPAPALSELVRSAGRLPGSAVRWIAAGTAQALVALHAQGIVHRDVKPQNILLPLAGPRLIDFGISHAFDITRTSLTLGTIAFTSPEQARAEPSTTASDVYSLGATLFHLAVGRPPYPDTDDTIRLLTLVQRGELDLTGLPKELSPLVRPCLAADPGGRPGPADILRGFLEELDRTGTSKRGERWLPPRWTALIQEYEAQGRALNEDGGAEAATLDARTRPVPPPGPTRVDTRERAARRERERMARALRERDARDRRAEAARQRREEEARRRARARSQGNARQARPSARTGAPAPSRPSSASGQPSGARRSSASGRSSGARPSSTPRTANSSAGGFSWLVFALVAVAVFIWQPWKDDTTSGSTGGTTASSSSGGGTGSLPTRDTYPSSGSDDSTSGGGSSSGSDSGSSGSASHADDETESPTTPPAPDPTEEAFEAVSTGDCLPVHDTGFGGERTVKWSAELPPDPVSCGSGRALVRVTGTTGAQCPSGVGKASWSYRAVSTGEVRSLCLSRVFHTSYCLLGRQSGDRISVGPMTAVDCSRSQRVPVPYNQIMHITGVYRAPAGANASHCVRGQGDRTRYWAWTVDDGSTLLCTTILQGG
ncbi:serine/threonine-protein kinase [Streptomyces sp. XD-27]|uniref:serine/threonine-protein kinase n=1 Tax=Streptomyces sp. XD-27 TaxID=3062779 RepID=UPI0026F42A0D|nr:serine/threonine-protein kinase [Streptomyces sp. XD-27]WKX73163.1 serine/threonine-protein kinase [Streptomyces sp. XD-27]